MMRTLIILLFFAALLTQNAHAELQYWVSVASYKQADEAEAARAKIAQQMTESFAVIGTETGKGYYYRVAAGPYLTRSLAEDRVQSARALGFTSAWLWADESDLNYSDSSVLTLDDDYSLDLPDYSSDMESNAVYDDTEDTLDEADLIQRRKAPPAVVEEAPPGYKLNRMRRDT